MALSTQFKLPQFKIPWLIDRNVNDVFTTIAHARDLCICVARVILLPGIRRAEEDDSYTREDLLH